METAIRSEPSVRFESFELNLRTRELFRNGVRVKLRGHPVDVLAILLEHPGELSTREMLRKRLWPDDTFVDFEQILNNSVGKLREALGDDADSPKFVETLPRLGYRFIARIEAPGPRIQVVPNAPLERPRSVALLLSQRTSKRRIIWVSTAAVVAVFAVLAFWYMHLPLPAPHISNYQQLTMDGRMKIPRGTDGARVFMNAVGGVKAHIVQVPVSGGKVTDFPIELPEGSKSQTFLANVSPDGSRLLVTNQFAMGKGFALWVVGNTGYPARYLMRSGSTGWSPDGKTLVSINPQGDIYTVGVEGGEPHLLHREESPASQTVRSRDVSWSPDGTTIRFTRFGGRIFEISSTGADLHEWLPGWNGGIQKCCGRWTPDGEFYLFMAERTLAKDPSFRPLAQIWAVDERRRKLRPRISEPILLISGPMLWSNPVPSLDGKKIFVRGVSLRGEIDRLSPSTKKLEPYLGGVSADMPAFSRDGRYVAYVSFPDGVLWRANRDGSGPVQLTEPPIYPRSPRWSPDGTQLVYTSNTQNGVDAIYIMSSQGGSPRRLLPHDSEPQTLADWSPDGSRLVYSTYPGFSLVAWDFEKTKTRIVELATGKVTTLPDYPRGFWAPLWSPDGRYIAGQSFPDKKELLVFDLNTGKWNVVSSKGFFDFHCWSHDGRFLYFVCQTQDKFALYRVPVQGGKEELILELNEEFHGTGWYSFWMSLDPDDAPLLLRDAGTDEIYALTLERK